MLESLEGQARRSAGASAAAGGQGTLRHADHRQQRDLARERTRSFFARGATFYRDYGVGKSRGTLPIQLAGKSSAAGSSSTPSARVCASCCTTTAAAAPRAGRFARCRSADRWVPTCPNRSSTRRSTTRRFAGDRRAARPRRHRRLRRHRRHGAHGALRDGVLRARVVRQMHSLPHRLDARRGGHRPDRARAGARREPAPARRSVRDDAAWLAVRAGRHDALPGAERAQAFPQRTSAPRARIEAQCASQRRSNMYAIDHEDLGTPAIRSGESVTLEIDGLRRHGAGGTSIMRAAALAGSSIPKLCATDTLKAFGSCRLCLVEIEGRKGYPASCTTAVADGMKVRTRSARSSRQLRRGVMELYVSDHPLDCEAVRPTAHCELQDMAAERRRHATRRYAPGRRRCTPELTRDVSNPYFTFDPASASPARAACEPATRLRARSRSPSRDAASPRRSSRARTSPSSTSECVSCGACVEACPTGCALPRSR